MKTNIFRKVLALVLTTLVCVSAWAQDTEKPTVTEKTLTLANCASTKATIAWFKATDNVTPDDQLRYILYLYKNLDDGVYRTYEVTWPNYTIWDLKPDTEYSVVLRAYDAAGNYTNYNMKSFRTNPKDSENPTISDPNIYVEKVTDTSITLKWTKATDNVSKQENLKYILFDMRGDTWNDGVVVGEGYDIDTYTVTGLAPGREYTFCLGVADQEIGFSFYNYKKVLTTGKYDGNPPVRNGYGYISDVTSTSITLHWNKATDDVTAQENIRYQVVRTVPETMNQDVKYWEYVKTDLIKDIDHYTFNDLEPNTKYLMYAVAYDESGNTNNCFRPLLDCFFTTTEKETVPPTLSNKTLTVNNSASNSVTLKWTKATDNVTAQKDIRYIVEHKSPDSPTYGRDATLRDINTYTVTNLTEGHEYVFRVRAVDEAGNYTFYNVVTAKTGTAQDLTAPTKTNSTITVSDVTYSSFKLSWTKATDNVTPQSDLQYYIYVKETGEIEYPGYFDKGYDISSCVVTGLEPSTKYTFMVRVVDKGQNSSYYIESTVTTKAKPATVEKYDVYVMYDQVTSKNANDILNDGGSLKYDATTNTLIMNNCNFEYDGEDAITLYSDVTIRLIGDNSLKGRIFADTSRKITFTGTGTLTVEGDIPYMGYGDLSIEGGCTVAFYGVNSNGISFDGDDTLYVIGSTLRARGSAPYASIYGCADLEMIDCDFGSDHRYEYGNYCFLDPWGDIAVDEIVISSKKMIRPEIEYDQITIDEITNNSAMATWNAATDDDTPQSDLVYRVFIRKSDGNGFDNYTNTKGVTSCCFTGLEPETSYDVFIKVVDSDGKEAFYRSTSFTTAKTPDDIAPTLHNNKVSVSGTTYNSVSLSWNKATDNKSGQSDLMYCVTVKESSKPETTGEYHGYEMKFAGADISSATITELDPETSYDFIVFVTDEQGNKTEYSKVTAVTDQESADVTSPTIDDASLRITSILDDNYTIEWNAATDDRTAQKDLTYYIYVKESTDSDYDGYWVKMNNMTRCVIYGVPGKSYEFYVKVADEAGNYALYNTNSVSVQDNEAPTLPDDRSITVTDVTYNTISITWNAATDNGTPQSKLQYTVEVKAKGAYRSEMIAVGNVTSYTLTDLNEETEYEICISVADESGNASRYVETVLSTIANGIDTILRDNLNIKMYTPSGQRATKNYKGVVIINGKKYLAK